MHEESDFVEVQNPAECQNGGCCKKHRYPYDTEARLFDREVIQVIAYRLVCQQTPCCPSIAVCGIQKRTREERGHGPANTKWKVYQARLPLIELVNVDEQD